MALVNSYAVESAVEDERAFWQHAALVNIALPVCAVLTSITLWWYSTRIINVAGVGDYGLLPLLPVTYFAAIGLIIASFLFSLTRNSQHSWVLGLHIVALIVVFHGTVPLVFPGVRYAWTYKHFGVVRYIIGHGSVDGSVDIYQNWPGFFAGSAWLSQLMGIPVNSWAGWSQVFFNLTYFVELAFLYQALGVPYRVQWLAILLFICGNWVGQDYFSPQAFSFTLSLAILAVALSWLRRDMSGPIAFVVRKVLINRDESKINHGKNPEQRRRGYFQRIRPVYTYLGQRRAPLIIVTGLFSVIVVSHQLSPYMILLALCGLVALGGLRPFWLLGLFAALALGFLGLHYSFVVNHFGPVFGGDAVANAAARPETAKPDHAVTVISDATRALTFTIWILGAIGFMRQQRGSQSLLIAVMAITPFVFLGGQSYGGEAIYRVYLFSLPWFSILAASGILAKRVSFPMRFVAVQTALMFTVAALFLCGYFGLEQVNTVRPTEVAAIDAFYDKAPRGALLLAGDEGLPMRDSASYTDFAKAGDTDRPPTLSADERFNNHLLGANDIPMLNDLIDSYHHPGFLIFSTSAIVYAHAYGQLPDGSLESLERAVSSNPGWKVWYTSTDARIYERIKAP